MAKLGKWSDEEIQFLKFAYPNKDFTTKDICKALDRSVSSIHRKASDLKLKKYKEDLPLNHKRCSKCKTVLPVSFFTKRKYGYDSWCCECYKVAKKKAKEIVDEEIVDEEIVDEEIVSKKCSYCGEIKSLNDFQRRSSTKDGYNASCKECRKKIYEKSKIKKLKERGW